MLYTVSVKIREATPQGEKIMKQTKEQMIEARKEEITMKAKYYNMSEEEVIEIMWEIQQEAEPCYEIKK